MAGEHAAQEAGALANVPTGHVDAVNAQEEAPAALKEPPAQGVHAVEDTAPVDVEYVPALQGFAVAEALAAAVQKPAAHAPQVAALTKLVPPSAKVPAAQGLAVAEEVPVGQK